MISRRVRITAKHHCGLSRHDSLPVRLIDGDRAPRVIGDSYYHTTLSGKTIVRYPSAYGWPTLYHASTRELIISSVWLARLS